MHKHAASVMKAVDVAVQGLGDDTTTAPATALALKALGGRHYKYGVKPMYFEVSQIFVEGKIGSLDVRNTTTVGHHVKDEKGKSASPKLCSKGHPI